MTDRVLRGGAAPAESPRAPTPPPPPRRIVTISEGAVRIEDRVTRLESDVAQAAALLAALAEDRVGRPSRDEEDDEGDVVTRIAARRQAVETAGGTAETVVPWSCRSCGALLGLYARERNELRIKPRRSTPVWVVTGRGGSVRRTCYRCSEDNTLRDEG